MQKSFEFSGSQGKRASLNLAMANRHGLITGATGSGKTVTLQTLVEGFSRAGVPAFVTDIKGDLSGLSKPGEQSSKIIARLEQLLLNTYSNRPYPVILWDLFGKKGHPVRTTISDMGPLLLSSLLDLNGTQTAILYACFKIADDEGLLLLDMKDLRSMLTWMAENRKSLQKAYGNISSASVAAIQRSLLVLEQQGAEQLFGEPVLQLRDLMQVDFSGNGVVSLLDATSLLPQPKLYSTFLLWLLAELFEQLPEVGDPEKPVLVLFFDEAHLIFKNAPDVLLEKVEQVVRLIRSKGVGVYFVSQTPADIPISIAGQLGNRIQHALRAFTPKDQKMVKAAAQTLRSNPKINTEQAISQLTVGEALVSVLDENGQPSPVEQLLIFPPQSRIGPLTQDERQQHLARSPLVSRYDVAIDRESAHEIIKQRAEKIALFEDNVKPVRKAAARTEKSQVEDLVGAMAKSAVRTIGTQLGRQIVRGLLGSLLGGKRR
jgi:DNA double-strand break repair helicase HerA and related ATPase